MENSMDKKVVFELKRALKSFSKYEMLAINEAGLTLTQYSVLEVLHQRGEMKVSKIIEKTLSTSGNMTVVIENLLKADLICRCTCPTDRRISNISISKKGADIITSIFPTHTVNINNALVNLNDDEKVQLFNLLKKFSCEN